MDFSLNEEQRMLAELVDRFVEKDYSFEARKASLRQAEGFSREQWRTLAATGLLGVNIPEAYGGMGGSPTDALVVMERFGSGLVVEPFVQNAVVAARLLAANGSESQKNRFFPALLAGETLFALACVERSGGFDMWHAQSRAVPDAAGGWDLSGTKSVVPYGDSADILVVPARTSGAPDDRHGISLFLVPRAAAGIEVQAFPSFDGQRVAEVRFTGVKLTRDALLGPEGEGYPALELGVDHGIAALCAEAVGAMQKLLELTTDYLRTRRQFGKPIGSFQALQHRAAGMVICLEQARAAAFMAAAGVEEPDAATRRRTVSAAKVLVGRCGRESGEAATQLHGGMGMTDEMMSGHYFKRLVGIDKTWGDSEHHVELYASLVT
ncbi:MAG: putative acyl-CoA dehydrogenase [Ramlibacter sp.]|jgi:alkylation response protein AidB-like acyl-CoA dehydrogenase|nr:putative acyl-CoA dehydrogenase [Ramlibacter sp.]